MGTLPDCIAAPAIAQGRLVARKVTGMRGTTHCYIAWRADEAGRALRWWVEQLGHPDLVDRFTTAALSVAARRVRDERHAEPALSATRRVRRSGRRAG